MLFFRYAGGFLFQRLVQNTCADFTDMVKYKEVEVRQPLNRRETTYIWDNSVNFSFLTSRILHVYGASCHLHCEIARRGNMNI